MKNIEKISIQGYRHTGIVVGDLQTSLYFYRDLLGLEVIQEHEDASDYISKITNLENLKAKYAKLRIPDGKILELLTYPSHPTSRLDTAIHNVGEAHLAFQVKSAETAYRYLMSKGVICLSEPVLSSEKIAIVFFCLDPDRYRVEIVEMI
jgi:catechol 2,3-dioxygenase-like lactoylglutathione lyase family enzyme